MKPINLLNCISGLLTLLPATLFLATSPAHASTLYGDTITCGGNFSGLFCGPASATAGPSVEFTLARGGVNPAQFLSLDFGKGDLLITALAGISFSNLDTLLFEDTSKAFPAESILSSTATTFGAGNVSLAGGILTVSLQGTQFAAGQTVDIGFTATTSSAAPEPGAVGFIAAFMLLAGMFWMQSIREHVHALGASRVTGLNSNGNPA